MASAVIGVLCFISVVFSFASTFRDVSNFEMWSIVPRAVLCMVMVIAGIGCMGFAASGVKLDAEEAYRDVEP